MKRIMSIIMVVMFASVIRVGDSTFVYDDDGQNYSIVKIGDSYFTYND